MLLLAVLALAAAACGGEESTATNEGVAETEASDTAGGDGEEAGGEGSEGEEAGGELPNACPAEGCEIEITGAEPGADGELQLTFEANFTPDFEQNHIHVYWDSQETGAVSSDFEAKGFEVQGDWHPTDEYPVYVTQSDASVDSASRADSTTICVTAADGDHAVIDSSIYNCTDVAALLSS